MKLWLKGLNNSLPHSSFPVQKKMFGFRDFLDRTISGTEAFVVPGNLNIIDYDRINFR